MQSRLPVIAYLDFFDLVIEGFQVVDDLFEQCQVHHAALEADGFHGFAVCLEAETTFVVTDTAHVNMYGKWRIQRDLIFKRYLGGRVDTWLNDSSNTLFFHSKSLFWGSFLVIWNVLGENLPAFFQHLNTCVVFPVDEAVVVAFVLQPQQFKVYCHA